MPAEGNWWKAGDQGLTTGLVLLVRASLPTGGLNQTGFMGLDGWTLIPNGAPEKIGDQWVLRDLVTWTSIPIGDPKQTGNWAGETGGVRIMVMRAGTLMTRGSGTLEMSSILGTSIVKQASLRIHLRGQDLGMVLDKKSSI